MSKLSKAMKFLEVRQRDDIYTEHGTTRWGSSMISFGLTAGEACGAVLIGSVLAGIMAVLCGQVGRDLHLGYPMMGRASFGLYGSYFVILIKVFVSFIFFGSQAYFGGEAIVIILNSIFPSFLRMKNTIPESSGITTPNLIGFILYFVIFVPVIFIRPHKLQRFLYPGFVVICATVFGLLGWAIHANHGSAGNLVAPAIKLSKSDQAFRMAQGICSTAASWTGAAVRGSDWTRYAKTRNAPIASQLTAAPFTITLTALIGVLVTSAAKEMYGTVIWNPLLLIQHVQHIQYTAACRAGTFFAGCGFLSSQIWVNITQNTISSGMDLAGLAPKYINMRRGALILATCGLIIQPWRYLTKATTFLSVLSGFGVFIAPITGVVIADFWVVRKQQWKIPDLYLQGGIYWYTWGLNWRAFASFWIAAIPSMPGFVASVGEYKIGRAATQIFQLNYSVGLAIAFLTFILFNKLFPPEGLGISEPFDDVIRGVPLSASVAASSTEEDAAEKGIISATVEPKM